jgi:hypothetical protein
MPAPTAVRRLGAVTTLYCVFLAGWWFGQPVRTEGCLEDRLSAGAGGRPAAVEPADPARYLGTLDLDFGLLDPIDEMDGFLDGEYGPSDYGYDTSGHGPCSYKKRARLLAWINGDRR